MTIEDLGLRKFLAIGSLVNVTKGFSWEIEGLEIADQLYSMSL